MIVIGVDSSLTATGVAVLSARVRRARVFEIRTKPVHASLVARAQRVAGIVRRFEIELNDWATPALLVIEAPSFGSRNRTQSQHERSGVFWGIVGVAVDHGIPVVEVSPRARAKYATGNGNAGKLSVLEATVRSYADLSPALRTDNQADALALAAMGARALGHPVESEITPAQLDAMNAVDWAHTKGTR